MSASKSTSRPPELYDQAVLSQDVASSGESHSRSRNASDAVHSANPSSISDAVARGCPHLGQRGTSNATIMGALAQVCYHPPKGRVLWGALNVPRIGDAARVDAPADVPDWGVSQSRRRKRRSRHNGLSFHTCLHFDVMIVRRWPGQAGLARGATR